MVVLMFVPLNPKLGTDEGTIEQLFNNVSSIILQDDIICNLQTVTHLYIFILQRFNVKPDCRYSLHSLVTFILQSIEDGRLAGIVQAEDEDSDLFRTEEALEEPIIVLRQ